MSTRRVIDLTRRLGSQTQVYPGDPEPVITPVADMAGDGYHLAEVRMGTQSGTHADAPYHFRTDGARIDELDPRLFLGPGVVVGLDGLKAREPITWARIAPLLGTPAPGTIVLVRTGWAERYGTSGYFEHPYLDGEVADRLLELGVRTLGVDGPNPDQTPEAAHPGGEWPVHRAFAAAGGVLIENLCRLEEVDFPQPWISALPIPLAAADGAPVRAVAMDLASGFN